MTGVAHQRISGISLDAALDWILAELGGFGTLDEILAHARKELLRPRDGLHRGWALLVEAEIKALERLVKEEI